MSRETTDAGNCQGSGNELLASGLGVGAVGALGALVTGAVCPLCIVATPALLAVGLVQKWRARRTASEVSPPAAPSA
ncbi:hypothetical protein JYK02_27470 [Corallococcus macrosporus]|uniref:Mercury transporter n=1 Tax=Corallococcus macrosporus TaxID=35 RepID=A0ABS3DIV9_9BACT|nr:hypothetical protein [Corallococcus macrosporus]MBN8231264.1 hypothetical protein [Corallococcus macrosporus]